MNNGGGPRWAGRGHGRVRPRPVRGRRDRKPRILSLSSRGTPVGQGTPPLRIRSLLDSKPPEIQIPGAWIDRGTAEGRDPSGPLAQLSRACCEGPATGSAPRTSRFTR